MWRQTSISCHRRAQKARTPSTGASRLRSPSDLVGYIVKTARRKKQVGVVEEVIYPGDSELSPPNLVVVNSEPDHCYGPEHHQIPYVERIVRSTDTQQRLLLVDLPRGLLDLGRQQAAFQYLEPLLQDFVSKEVAERKAFDQADGSMLQQSPDQAPQPRPEQAPQPRDQAQQQPRMPTRAALRAAGRADILRALRAAGGSLAVAQRLGLRCRRRPTGFWDSTDNLDEELSQFVAGQWVALPDAATGGHYYYNQVTGRTQWDEPITPHKLELDDEGSFLVVEDEADRVMPSRTAVLAAARYDLHHAIQYCGGYRAVAEMLERPAAWPRFQSLRDPVALRADLQAFVKEQKLPEDTMPPAAALRDAGRHELLNAINQAGGSHAVAGQLGWGTQRRERAAMADMDAAAAALAEHLAQLPRSCRGRMPTHAELRAAGRHDLRYAVQLHGSEALAHRLGIKPNRRGRLRLMD
ncbi:g5970 [Coccomyxa elongata]